MKKLGFGCMRLPMIGGAEGTVDLEQFSAMIDRYMEAGFCYYDTARVYIGGQSETALRECLVKRYPRESFLLTDKLSGSQYSSAEEIRPLFESQLQAVGVDYFDYYLLHSLSEEVYEKCVACNAFQIVQELKAEGKVRHFGISFHDTAEVLDKILTEHPEIEIVQIQFNYLDVCNTSVDSMGVYQICRKHNKPVLIMEPVKGGVLAQLPPEAQVEFERLNGGCPANYAIRYAASFDGVFMVLSGMSTTEQMESNISCMENFVPLSQEEFAAVDRVCEILRKEDMIPCTGCRYCVAGCPKQIRIPDLFSCANSRKRFQDWSSSFYYELHTYSNGKPEDCIGCKKCERICPQHLPITQLLPEVAELFKTEEV